jgi:hypothetical protein
MFHLTLINKQKIPSRLDEAKAQERCGGLESLAASKFEPFQEIKPGTYHLCELSL